jgi:hypothetical protein
MPSVAAMLELAPHSRRPESELENGATEARSKGQIGAAAPACFGCDSGVTRP